ncbi:MAG: OmpA family protein [Acidobacteria bacterium]|nr:OmpA family protein [Acidobacteriota bacterium]
MRPDRILPLTASALVLGVGLACSKPEPAPPIRTEPRAPATDTGTAPTAPADTTGKVSAVDTMEMARKAAAAALKDINFDFDKSDIREADKPKLQAIAGFLKNYAQVRLTVEGHCDERGTVEYNIALGDRRAHAALRYLAGLGVSENRLSPVSFGKERPRVTGHDEQSWFENRRCEFKMAN